MASVFKRGGKNNRGGAYYMAWKDYAGRRRVECAQTTDKAAAERIAAKREADAALRREGVIAPTLEAICQEAQRSIESHLIDYEAKLRAAGRTDKHVKSTLGFIRVIARHGGLSLAGEITADGVARYAQALSDKGQAARTIGAHLAAAKGFTKWMTEHHKLPRDPLMSVKKPNPKTDRRRLRRMLLPEEWQYFQAATLGGPERYGMTGPERWLLYRSAIESGLRSSELRSLTRGRLYLKESKPYITCSASATKNRQDGRQYIQAELAEALQAHVATKAPGAPVFTMPDETDVATMLRADLADARQEWLHEVVEDADAYAQREQSDFLAPTNHDGESLDFHALRHTCGAWLAMKGVHPKTVQTVMRHSTITLTMDTYGHLFPGQEAEAVANLGDLLACPKESLRATGTDSGSPRRDGAQRQAQRARRDSVRVAAAICDAIDGAVHPTDQENALAIADMSDALLDHATKCESSGAGTRTPDTRIMIPLL